MNEPAMAATRRLLVRIVAAALAATAVVRVGPAIAAFAMTVSVGGNTLATGTWAGSELYLHNRPSPPVGNTAAQVNLAMDATVPTAATLFRYSSDIATDKGRVIQRSANGLSETDARKYVNWRSPAFAAAKTISGTVVVGLWGQPFGQKGTDATVTVYLRDFNPAGGGAYAEITSVTVRNPTWATGKAFVELPISIPVGSYTIASGHVLELRVMAPTTGAADVVLAYDVVAYQSALRLP